MVTDENKKIRLTTLESLGNIGDEKALPYLTILKNKEKDEKCLSAIEDSINKIIRKVE
ncbi:hypothetical protein MBGDC06_00022 [Thermoplasmatales archaeon SCGC AB-539-C06]|nr:hypothetical protein MBGDC06_00022 [Thermoplasmatales archaeon SCGC AB-539-C06]